jgi:hypothetical protein
VVAHALSLREEGRRLRAGLTANGYQTSVDLVARAEVAGARLVIRFERDGENQVPLERYKPGEVLLELERKCAALLTHWRAYRSATRERFANPGAYFKGAPASRR